MILTSNLGWCGTTAGLNDRDSLFACSMLFLALMLDGPDLMSWAEKENTQKRLCNSWHSLNSTISETCCCYMFLGWLYYIVLGFKFYPKLQREWSFLCWDFPIRDTKVELAATIGNSSSEQLGASVRPWMRNGSASQMGKEMWGVKVHMWVVGTWKLRSTNLHDTSFFA